MDVYVKRSAAAPARFFACEAAGLQWLSAAAGGAPCARVIEHDDVSLTLERLHAVPASRDAAREFGARLAVTHDAGASSFGAGPDGWDGPGFFGPMSQPVPMSLTGHDRWGAFYARERLAPMTKRAASKLSRDTREIVDAVIARGDAGDFDDDDPPCRLHGDLWSGNVITDSRGQPVLIDPAVYGGHREVDLAMLALFGGLSPRVVAAYEARTPLAAGWKARTRLWQIYPLLVHTVLFRGSYVDAAEAAMRAYL